MVNTNNGMLQQPGVEVNNSLYGGFPPPVGNPDPMGMQELGETELVTY